MKEKRSIAENMHTVKVKEQQRLLLLSSPKNDDAKCI